MTIKDIIYRNIHVDTLETQTEWHVYGSLLINVRRNYPNIESFKYVWKFVEPGLKDTVLLETLDRLYDGLNDKERKQNPANFKVISREIPNGEGWSISASKLFESRYSIAKSISYLNYEKVLKGFKEMVKISIMQQIYTEKIITRIYPW